MSLPSQVVVLKMELKEKENEIQKLLLDFNETQKQCKQLQEASSKIMIKSTMRYSCLYRLS